MDEVPGEVGLGAHAERDVGEDVDEFVDAVHGGELSACQLHQQPQVEGNTVDLHKESEYSAGYIQLSVEGVQETRDHLRRDTHREMEVFLDVRCFYLLCLSYICLYLHLPCFYRLLFHLRYIVSKS